MLFYSTLTCPINSKTQVLVHLFVFVKAPKYENNFLDIDIYGGRSSYFAIFAMHYRSSIFILPQMFPIFIHINIFHIMELETDFLQKFQKFCDSPIKHFWNTKLNTDHISDLYYFILR